jgi:chemotaxis protein CheX
MSAAQKISNPLFDKNLVNAFFDSAKKTLSSMANVTVKAENPYIEKQFTAKGDVAGIVGLTASSHKGTLSISFEKKTIFFIISKMLGEEYTEVTPEVVDAVGELTNMIYGEAKTNLNLQGYSFEAAIPTIVIGQHILHSRTGATATIVVPFVSEGGKFFVELTITT